MPANAPATPEHSRWRALGKAGGFLVLGLAVVLLARRGAEILPQALEVVRGLGPWAAVGFIGLYGIATVAWIPGSVLTLAAGAVFGLVWGTLFTVSGAALVLVGAGGMVTARSVIELNDDAVRLRVAGPMSYMDIPWSDIRSIRSGRDYGDDGRIPTPVLLIEVQNRARYPDGLWGAVWRGDTLQIDADAWDTSVEDVVIRAELMTERLNEGDEE